MCYMLESNIWTFSSMVKHWVCDHDSLGRNWFIHHLWHIKNSNYYLWVWHITGVRKVCLNTFDTFVGWFDQKADCINCWLLHKDEALRIKGIFADCFKKKTDCIIKNIIPYYVHADSQIVSKLQNNKTVQMCRLSLNSDQIALLCN